MTTFLQYWVLFGGLAAVVLATLATAALMRQLDARRHRRLGATSLIAGVAYVGLLLAFGLGGPGVSMPMSSIPYGVALATLLGATMMRQSNPRRSEGRGKRFRPSTMIALAGAVLIVVLWLIELTVGAVYSAKSPSMFFSDLFRAVPAGAAPPISMPLTVPIFLATTVVAGVLAMAVLQGIRGLVPVRGAFHRASVRQWLDETGTTPKSKTPLERKPLESKLREWWPKDAIDTPDDTQRLENLSQLASAASGRERYAFFDLPIEQLCGQIAAGADRLLDAPLKYYGDETAPNPAKELLVSLAGPDQNVQRFLDLAVKVDIPSPDAPPKDEDDEARDERKRREYLAAEDRQRALPEYMKLRATLSQAIQRNVDRLQIDTTFWWRRLLRGTAFIMCAVVGRAALGDPIAAALCGITGGFIASLSRDLVAIVEKARR